MLDRSVRKLIDPLLEHPARWLSARRVSANTITVVGFLIGVLACVAIGFEKYRVGLVLLALNRICDGIDGTLARLTKPTDLGGFLDIVLDMLFYAGVPLAFAIRNPELRLPALFLVFSFIGTSGSFLAFATITARRGISSDRVGKKSFYYSTGLMEGTETIIFFVLFCIFPAHFAGLAWTFGTLCCLTTALRIRAAIAEFSSSAES